MKAYLLPVMWELREQEENILLLLILMMKWS